MLSVLEYLKMGCWTTITSFHVKIILLDKQELIQEVQVLTRQPCQHTFLLTSHTKLGITSRFIQYTLSVKLSVKLYLQTADRNVFLKSQFVR